MSIATQNHRLTLCPPQGWPGSQLTSIAVRWGQPRVEGYLIAFAELKLSHKETTNYSSYLLYLTN
jgi:hypothetical protein